MLDELKKDVCEANLKLVAEGLVVQTFGNASGIDRAGGNVVIKPSGVPYDDMKPKHMVVVSLVTGEIVEGDLRPSSDTPSHLELYRAFKGAGGIVHTHSLYATAWAQSGREIPPLGTTHADFFRGPVPVTRRMTAQEIRENYEANTGKVIVERFSSMDPMDIPAVLVTGHAPFVWGRTVQEAVENSTALEYVARLAAETLHIYPYPKCISKELLEKHFLRKHGPQAYYGQG